MLTGFNRVVAFGSFTRQHDTIRTVENGVGDVTDLSTSWPWVVLHKMLNNLQVQEIDLTVIDCTTSSQIHE